MNERDKLNPAQAALTMWVIWFAIVTGLFIIRVFAAPALMQEDSGQPLELGLISAIALTSAAGGMIVRWLVIPRIQSLEARLQAMVVGLALCEGCGILGMFVAGGGEEARLLFSVSAACLIVSAPIYTRAARKPSPFHQS